jgi:tetratricopeptide (TPR) repeat protein
MAKTRRNAARPAPGRPAKAMGASKKAQARPAVKKTARPASRPAAARRVSRPAAKPAARPTKPARPVKPAARPAAKAAKPAVRPAPAKPAARAVKAPPSPPPQRSTYADAVSLYERGMQALQAKRYREAAETLKAVIARFPEEKELHERAQLYIRVCERQLTPLDATPKTPEEQVYAATLAINTGQVDRAVALLTAAVQQDPENDPAEYMLGVAYSLKGDLASALTHIARALELNPDNRELVRKEPDLDALRQTDEIRAILAAPPELPRKDRRPAPRRR